ncbi:MAG: DUF1566 domain-containing protein [Deltaproteobacteria bacterium]|nr:DUF1566 domain-containing protein [Deltaproteobacteria bacterium]
MAIVSDRSLPNRLGLEVDDIELTASVGTDPAPCGDVNGSGKLTAADALAVLKAAVGQPIALQCEASGQPLKTGQSACYDAAGAGISCIGSGQDGEYQYGVARAFTDNGDGTITDHATGLMWEKLADDGGVHDVDNVYTWPEAFSAKIATLNSALFAGFSDWRVPNLAELQTLPNFAAWNPAAFAPFHTACSPGCGVTACSCTRALPFWTSTSFAEIPGLAWAHSAAEGATFPSAKDAYSLRVRAVRRGH